VDSRARPGPHQPAEGGTDTGAAPRRSATRAEREVSRRSEREVSQRPGTSDPRAARARELHRKAAEADELAARYRLERDRLILRLRAEDPASWSYTVMASALGCSRELVALVCRRSRHAVRQP